MTYFDYGAAAELFPSRQRTRMMGAVTYMRFAAAAGLRGRGNGKLPLRVGAGS
jgi:hypothetical protein